MVAILHPASGFVHRARAHVDAEVGRAADLAAGRDELIGAEAVRFALEPRQIVARRTRVLRTDAVLPVITGGEVAARPAQLDRKSTRLNSSHQKISYAVFC